MMALLGLAVAAQVAAAPLPQVTAPAAPAGTRVWIGYGDRLNFAFGDALSRALAGSALPTDRRPALRRIVAPRKPDGAFRYAVDILQKGRKDHERVARTYGGRCTAATLDTCAADVAARIARRGS